MFVVGGWAGGWAGCSGAWPWLGHDLAIACPWLDHSLAMAWPWPGPGQPMPWPRPSQCHGLAISWLWPGSWPGHAFERTHKCTDVAHTRVRAHRYPIHIWTHRQQPCSRTATANCRPPTHPFTRAHAYTCTCTRLCVCAYVHWRARAHTSSRPVAEGRSAASAPAAQLHASRIPRLQLTCVCTPWRGMACVHNACAYVC